MGVSKNLLKGNIHEVWGRKSPVGSKGQSPGGSLAAKPPEAGDKDGCKLYRTQWKYKTYQYWNQLNENMIRIKCYLWRREGMFPLYPLWLRLCYHAYTTTAAAAADTAIELIIAQVVNRWRSVYWCQCSKTNIACDAAYTASDPTHTVIISINLCFHLH